MESNQILLDSFEFDYLVLGTGLSDSLFAACLAKNKKRVLVLDLDRSYSSSLQTVNLKEFLSLFTQSEPQKSNENETNLKKSSIFSRFSYNKTLFDQNLHDPKGYNIDLQPKILFSTSLTVDLMKEADMDKYMEFRAISAIFHYDNVEKKFIEAPSSKGQIFTHKDLSLLEKRVLFKTLQSFITLFHLKNDVKIDPNSTSEFDKPLELDSLFLSKFEQFKHSDCSFFLESLGIKGKVREILLYTLCLCCEDQDSPQTQKISTNELFVRMFKFVKSLGVHSSLPFLYAIYGTGDIPQAFARIAAVHGSLFIINPEIKVQKIEKNEKEFRVYSDIAGNKGYFSCMEGIVVGMEYQSSTLKVFEKNSEVFEMKEDNEKEGKKSILLRVSMIWEGEFFLGKEEEADESHSNSIKRLPLIYVVPPKNPEISNINPLFLLFFGSNTCTCPKGRILMNAQTVIYNKDFDSSSFSAKLADFIHKYIKPDVFEWKLVFSGEYLQEQASGSVGLSDVSGLTLLKNCDFSLDLDGYFSEFVENISKLIPEYTNKDKGYFTREGGADEGEEEQSGGEIKKLLAKLDEIVLSKDQTSQ